MTSGPNIPRSQRIRRKMELSLEPKAWAILKALPKGKASELVSELVLDWSSSAAQAYVVSKAEAILKAVRKLGYRRGR